MTDNIVLNPGFGGDVIAADDVSGVQHQLIKVEYGDANSATQVSSGNPLPVSVASTGSVPLIISTHLDSIGDGTGVINANSDYSSGGSGSTEFFIAPPTGSAYRIHRLIVFVEDVGSFDSGFYGNSVVLGNGMTVTIESGSTTLVDLTNGHPITTNSSWAHFCHDLTVFTFGTGNEFMSVRWTFAKSGTPVRLENPERLVVTLNDDLTGLVAHHFLVQGFDETQLT